MFDYKSLQALAAVIDQQSFEKAAEKIFITQSAISQRIKSLENYYGQPLLIREVPYAPTTLGQMLLSHYHKAKLLEDDTSARLTMHVERARLAIAINRDSLDIWFPKVFQSLGKQNTILLEVITDDQDVTLDYFKKGLVSACVSTTEKPVSGCRVDFLGYMDYLLVASPDFKRQYFNKAADYKQNLINAPAVIFDAKDNLHALYLERFFDIHNEAPNYHIVPSVHGFKQFTTLGYGYALIPHIDIKKELQSKKLVELFPKKIWRMPLYWHSWQIQTEQYTHFNKLVVSVAKNILGQ
ncbi:MAG: LysR family transcriptional regulator ArgP [Pseudomonadota bacterium]|nr:LysR family transcriptional regulator ArgP [Pseudomonadota bacterium]